eukprot:TRINITY_DN2300_c0_g3_i2.p1 TRINITY_DN2300_c0_g3~~TRINITY_DN2300_c0_g3_i2.p1  ORF type:complete len:438 (+),score=91.66 TRINITY_DN2300_c0_g3_i2:262-1575(+)
MSDDQKTWFGSVINLGAGLGGVLGGFPVDMFGKRTGMIVANTFLLVGYLMILLCKAPSFGHSNTQQMTQFYAARVLQGVGIGFVCCSVGNYQVEISTLPLRGAIGTCFQVGVVAGIFMVYFLGLWIRYESLSVIVLVVNAVGIVFAFTIPESPVWLLSKGRKEEAEAALKRLRSSDSQVTEILEKMESELNQDDVEESSESVIEKMSKAPRMKALMIGVGLMFVQQLSGINAVMFYASKILGTVWTDDDTVNQVAVGVQAMQFLLTIVAAPIVDKAGRKAMLTIASVGLVFCCMAMSSYYFWASTVPKGILILGFYGYVAFFSMGMGAVPWFIMGEIFHPEVKGISSAIATMCNWLLSFAITKTVDTFVKAFSTNSDPSDINGETPSGHGWLFVMYGSVCFLGVFFIRFVLPETKGKSYAVLEKELMGRNSYAEISK